MLQPGVALIHIRDILGHVDIPATEVYARADLDMKRKALERAAAAPNAVAKPNLSSWHENKDLLDWLSSLYRRDYALPPPSRTPKRKTWRTSPRIVTTSA